MAQITGHGPRGPGFHGEIRMVTGIEDLSYEVFLFDTERPRGLAVSQVVMEDGRFSLVEVEPGAAAERPSFRLPRRVAQGLMDAFYEYGLRPNMDATEAEGIRGQLTAKSEHVDDLRMVVEKLFERVGHGAP